MIAFFPNGSSFERWRSRNCNVCARFEQDAAANGSPDCGCDLEMCVSIAGAVEPTAQQLTRLKYEGRGYMTHDCPEFIPEGEQVPKADHPDQTFMELKE